MHRSSFPTVFASLLGAAALLAGCCANDTCDCNDLLEDAIPFRFRIGDPARDPTSFRPEEVDTVRVVRYRLPPRKDPNSTAAPATVVPDTVVLTRTRSSAGPADSTFRIANTAPFAISGTLRVNSYRYAILLTSGNRRAPIVRQRYDISSIRLDGGYQADGCCTCYQNRQKEAYLRTSAPGTNVPAAGDSIFYDFKQPSSALIELRRPR